MTPRERFIAALERRPLTGLVPHFELVFYLTMEAFGTVHPTHRVFRQWNQMSAHEQDLQVRDVARVYVETARRYGHSAIHVQEDPANFEWTSRVLAAIREMSGDTYFLGLHGDPTFAIPDGDGMLAFSEALYEEPESLHRRAERQLAECIEQTERYVKAGGLLDGIFLCSDYCFNTNPFLSPSMFGEFITPYLSRVIRAYRDMGLYTIKHTDGNIMPIVDQMIECNPHALHSLDPQAGVDLREMRRRYRDKVCLIGNVNCGLLQTGTEEECIRDVERALRDGMADGPGYIFATSNCVYTGLPLERYELMQRVWKEKGVYPD